MTTLTDHDFPTTLATSTVSLRILQPGADERVVPLSTGKCTVGSSDRCQVHLTDAQVRPLHCLIVHEATGTSVTRWAPGALLNDQDFATAPFQPGDCLQIGEVQLLLVAEAIDSSTPQNEPEPPSVPVASNPFAMPAAVVTNSAFAPPASFAPPISPVVQPTKEPTAPVANVVSPLEAAPHFDRLKLANDGARKRCRKLVGALRTKRTEASSFEQRIDELEQQLTVALAEREQIFTQLSQLQGDAGERESQSSEEIDRLISELTAAYEKAGEAEAKLEEHVQEGEQNQSELASLQGQREQWEQIRSAGELQRNKLTQALVEREQSIETLQTEVEQSREAASQAEANCAEQTATLEALQVELEQVQSEREQLVAVQAESRQRQQDAEQSQADSEQNLAVFQLELEKFQITSRNTEQELFESKSALENLQTEFAPLAEERDQLATKRTEYQLREQGWEHELTSRDSQIETLSGEIEQLRTTLAEANQGAASQVSQVENFEQQLGLLTNERDQLLAAQAEQVQKVQEWEETVASRDRRIRELEEEHVGICEMLQSVEKGAFEQVDSCNKLEQQLAGIRAERDQLADALPEQQAYAKQLEQALAERDGQITLLSDELTKTAERQSELEIELAQGTSAFQSLEVEMSELTARCEQLVAGQRVSDQSKADVEQTLVEYQGLIEELQQQIESTQQQRQELEQVVANGSQSSETFQAELAELKSRYEQLTSNHQAETERRHNLDQQLAERDQNIELFQVDLKSNQAELDRTGGQVSSLQTECETLNQQLLGLREELAAREQQASQEQVDEAANVDLQLERDKLASELATVRQQFEEIQQQTEVAAGQASESQELLTQLEEEKSLLQQRVEQQDQQAGQLAAELEQARQCLQNAEQSLLVRETESIVEPAETQEQVVEEAVVWPTEPKAESSDDAAEAEAYYEAAQETPQETVDCHDAYATEETCETEEIVEDSVAVDSVAAEGIEPVESTSTAFDKQETGPEEPTEEPEEFQPTSFIDQYKHLLDDDDEVSLESAASVPELEPEPDVPATNKLGAELDALDTGSEDDTDEALQAYMSNMLRRMRGDENDDDSQPPQASSSTTLNQNPNPVAAVDDVLDQVAPEREVAEEPKNLDPICLEELKRSSHKPTLPTDLAAMRALANSSARGAIAKHHKRRHLDKALGLFFVCLIAIGVGGYMLWSTFAVQDFLSLKFFGGSAAVVVGLFGVFKILGLLLLAIREGAWEKKTPVKKIG